MSYHQRTIYIFRNYFLFLPLISILPPASYGQSPNQNGWVITSSQDNYEVTAKDNRIFVGDVEGNKKAFDGFLKLLLRSNRNTCPILGKTLLTVEAKSGGTTVIKKFYPIEGAIEANGKCANLEYDEGWSLPFHREWLTAEDSGQIQVGNTLNFKSSGLNFQLKKKGDEWGATGFIPDLLRMTNFIKTAGNFKIEKRYSKKVKDKSTPSFTLMTGGSTYKFYNIAGLWAVEFPKSTSLAATRDFSMLGKFTEAELGDNRSDDFGLLSDKTTPVQARIEVLQKLSNVDSPTFKTTLHRIVQDPAEDATLKEHVLLFLVDRPSSENLGALMTVLERSPLKDKILATKALRRLNSTGPLISEKDEGETAEKIQKWKEWYNRYLKARK